MRLRDMMILAGIFGLAHSQNLEAEVFELSRTYIYSKVRQEGLEQYSKKTYSCRNPNKYSPMYRDKRKEIAKFRPCLHR